MECVLSDEQIRLKCLEIATNFSSNSISHCFYYAEIMHSYVKRGLRQFAINDKFSTDSLNAIIDEIVEKLTRNSSASDKRDNA